MYSLEEKEAFSDGVSSEDKAWYQIIQDHIENIGDHNGSIYNHNIPTTPEQEYYRNEFENNFGYCAKLVPYFWMPKYVNAKDSSARSLEIYQDQNL